MTLPLQDKALAALKDHQEHGLMRNVTEVEACNGAVIMVQGKSYISFASNDYLGLSQHEAVRKAASDAALGMTGAGASRAVTGQHHYYTAFEEELAKVKHYESALLFGSGYLANMGAITALINKGDVVLMDRLCHACMWDGAKLSGAKVIPFAHNNMADVEAKLARYQKVGAQIWVLSETIFSMDGDAALLEELRELASRYGAYILADDAHGFGVAGESLHHASAYADVLTGTCSKALGSYGGYVCAAEPVVELIRQKARSMMFSTALPPSVVAGNYAALKCLRDNDELRKKPLRLAKMLTTLLNVPEAQSPIVPWVVGGNDAALALQARLKEQGMWVPAIRPPTVPDGSARLRITISALHDEAQIEQLAEALHD